MKGLCRLFVAVKTVSQIKYGQNKVGGGGGREERGEKGKRGREVEKQCQVFLAKRKS